MRTRWWLIVAAYVAILFAMQPRLGFVVDAVKERWGVPAFERAMLAAAVAAGLLFVALVTRIWRAASRTDRMLLVAVAVLYVVGVSLLDIPQERLHYVEYGLLAGLVYFACRRDLKRNMSTWQAAFAAIVITIGLGYLDEKLQGALWERRYFDWRDVLLNAQAAVLGTLASVPVERVGNRGREPGLPPRPASA